MTFASIYLHAVQLSSSNLTLVGQCRCRHRLYFHSLPYIKEGVTLTIECWIYFKVLFKHWTFWMLVIFVWVWVVVQSNCNHLLCLKIRSPSYIGEVEKSISSNECKSRGRHHEIREFKALLQLLLTSAVALCSTEIFSSMFYFLTISAHQLCLQMQQEAFFS